MKAVSSMSLVGCLFWLHVSAAAVGGDDPSNPGPLEPVFDQTQITFFKRQIEPIPQRDCYRMLAFFNSLNRYGAAACTTLNEWRNRRSPPRAGQVDCQPRESVNRARHGEPPLAVSFWSWDRPHAERSLLLPILATHDVAESDTTCPVRFATTQPTQSLAMMNSEFLNQQAKVFADHLYRHAGSGPRDQVEKDLKQRGLLKGTLVVWGGEFGRQPTADYAKGMGRDHNSYGFTMWLAGGGVPGGVCVGKTDELVSQAVEDRLHVKHLHATILHQLGLDPNRLTYFYGGLESTLKHVGLVCLQVARTRNTDGEELPSHACQRLSGTLHFCGQAPDCPVAARAIRR